MIVGLTICKNEDWILGLSTRAALSWCDKVVVVDHSSTDRTPTILQTIAEEYPGRLHLEKWPDDGVWREMRMRQRSLELGRAVGGTHFAIVDGDEVLTGNLIEYIRRAIGNLKPGQCLDLPMIPCWRSLDNYRDDASCWSHSSLTLAFRDEPGLYWSAAGDGYEHHARPPKTKRPLAHIQSWDDKARGGVMHLQFAYWRRLRAKHAWYKMMETIRYPGRKPPSQIDTLYNMALDESGIKTHPCRPEWWEVHHPHRRYVDMESPPWHEQACRKMWAEFGAARFMGLTLWGIPET